MGGSLCPIELSRAAADVLASLKASDGQRVAAALTALRREAWPEAKGASAKGFIEARAGSFRLIYRFDRDRIKVALLARMTDWRPRETPRLGLRRDLDD